MDDRLQGGGLLDSNRDNVIAASEGISLVQVTGSASADSFRLSNGYVAAGPWQYGLYSFAPGSSAGGNVWDYRLANNFICSDGSLCQPQAGSAVKAVRPAVTPQVPSGFPHRSGWRTTRWQSLTICISDSANCASSRQTTQRCLSAISVRICSIEAIAAGCWGYDFDLNYSAVQLGGNLLRADGAEDMRGGVAYTRGNTRIRPHAADGYSSTSFDSDTLSLYGTAAQQWLVCRWFAELERLPWRNRHCAAESGRQTQRARLDGVSRVWLSADAGG